MDCAVKRDGWLWAVAALVFFQASDVTLRIASAHTPFAVGAVLQATPLLLVSLGVALRRRLLRRDKLSGRVVAASAAYGALQFFAGNMLFYAAVQHGGLSIASPAVQSQAIWAVLLGGIVLGETVSRTMKCGIALFVAGLATLAWFKAAHAPVAGGWQWGLALGIAGGLAWAGASAVQSAQLRRGAPLSYVLAIGAATGVLALHAFILLRYGHSAWTQTELAEGWKVVAAGCFNGLAVWSISQALQTLDIAKVIPVVSLSIVCNTIIGKFAFGEYVNWGSAAGMALAFVGVAIAQEPKFGAANKSRGVEA